MTDESDQIARLEQRVQSLEATVEGLTEELVEANERIRALESGENADAATAVDVTAEPTEGAEDAADTPKSAESREGAEDTEESDLDDIIVA